MVHCLYEKARLYDLCEAGLNFLQQSQKLVLADVQIEIIQNHLIVK